MLHHIGKAYCRVVETAHNHLLLCREAKLMADIKDLAARATALAPRVQAAITAAAADATSSATATASAAAQAAIADDLNTIDQGLAATEALAPALTPVPDPNAPTG